MHVDRTRSLCVGERTCVRVGFQPYEVPWREEKGRGVMMGILALYLGPEIDMVKS